MKTRMVLVALSLALAFSATRAMEPTNEADTAPMMITSLTDSMIYPDIERRKGDDGRVELDALVDTNGNVLDVKYIYASTSAFWEAAKDAMLKMRYHPAIHNGRPIEVWTTETIHFKLTGSGQRKEPNPGDGIPGVG